MLPTAIKNTLIYEGRFTRFIVNVDFNLIMLSFVWETLFETLLT